MEGAGLDAVLLTKPQNMMYLVGDGRLCAFTIVFKGGDTYVGVPKTDLEGETVFVNLVEFSPIKKGKGNYVAIVEHESEKTFRAMLMTWDEGINKFYICIT